MSKKNDVKLYELYLKGLRKEAEEQKRRLELRRRLLKYDAKLIPGNFVSITETNYISIIEYDPDCLLLIHDLNYKIQFKAGL